MPAGKIFDESYARLNLEQKKAVDAIDGPVMVIAGPGTGKTQVLSLRVGNILQKTDIAPGNILCLTFTDAAAVNMRERLAELIGPEGYKVAVHTFHSFARDVIAGYPEYFYNGADFIAADDLAQLGILEGIFAELPRRDPLSSKHDEGFTYIKDARRAIGLLKQAGITPDEFAALIEANAKALSAINDGIARVFADRLSQKSVEAAAALAQEWAGMMSPPRTTDYGLRTLSEAAALSLGRAVKAALESEKIVPLSEWKSKWTKAGEDGTRVHKDMPALGRMRSLALVYDRYRARMYAEKLYDFDDMLLDVVLALREHPALCASLQERYQYVLVDEFQDTNDAQLKLVRLLGDAPVNEGKPNIMIVGDDDQAIYRFQGAEISNILDFPKQYTHHELVVLTKNYRSTQHILDVAREVIEKSTERLEDVIPALEKKLIMARPDLGAGHIRHAALPTRSHEYAYIAREIKRLIEEGGDPGAIAVITRRHRELEGIARVLVAANIPIVYERQQNVFDEPHIRILIAMARFVDSVVRHDLQAADEYLPEILSAPFFGVAREDIWRISVSASVRPDRSWLGAMQESQSEMLRAIAQWFMELGRRAHHDPLERVLDEMIGSDGVLVGSGARDEHEPSLFGGAEEPKRAASKFRSPFREYYFGADARKRAEARYLMFLSSLRVFVGALREYKHGKPLFIADLVDFADLHERNGLTLADTTPFASAAHAVNLMTAHKAKGLEFDTVFVASCQEEVWAGRGFPNKLPFPMNLPIERDEGGDDRLRIFYVALTRAKRRLYLSSYRKDDAGKSSLKLSFIAPERADGAIAAHLADEEAALADDELTGAIDIMPVHPEFFPIVPGERAILLELVRDYRMSVTHLNNFLNVAAGGPARFLEQNLLRFPQALAPNAAYGDAMHKAIERFYREFRRTTSLPDAEHLVGFFREAMERERMTARERAHFFRAGAEALPVWWKESGSKADPSHRSETDFGNQGVVAGGAPIVGKIDKMVARGDEIVVTDFKTGKAKERWEGEHAHERITLANYRRQLFFYKLLVERSHDFGKFTVRCGVLEFLEPVGGKIKMLSLELEEEETERLQRLIGIVYKKIMTLDFPDTERYATDRDGARQFEEDLLRGSI